MRVIITIGWQKFLLPSDVGAANVVKTMAKALPVKCWYHGQPLEIDDRRGNEFQIEYVPDNVEIIRKGTVVEVNPPSAKTIKTTANKLLIA